MCYPLPTALLSSLGQGHRGRLRRDSSKHPRPGLLLGPLAPFWVLVLRLLAPPKPLSFQTFVFSPLRIAASKAEGLEEVPVVGPQAVVSSGRRRIHPWRLPRSPDREQIGAAVLRPPPAFTVQHVPSDYPPAWVAVSRPGTSVCDGDSLAESDSGFILSYFTAETNPTLCPWSIRLRCG